MTNGPEPAYGQSTDWQPERPRLRLFPLLVSWLATGVALMVAAAIVPGVDIESFWGALLVAAIVAALNAVHPARTRCAEAAAHARARLPARSDRGRAHPPGCADDVTDGVLDGRQLRLGASRRARGRRRERRARGDPRARDDTSSIRIAQRIAAGRAIIARPTSRGSSSSRSTGSRCPCCAGRCATATRRTWPAGCADDTHRLVEWETDLSSQTGASQAGILLGSNEDISAFRWVEKETATMMTCSAPPDCAEIERRRATGIGLLVDGGASRGNLLSGEADDVILTVSRMEAEKKSNPGYRASSRTATTPRARSSSSSGR